MCSLFGSAIASEVVAVICFAQYFRIMLFDDGSEVGGTVITQLQSVSLANVMVFVVIEEGFPC